jgi:hypothetical protein
VLTKRSEEEAGTDCERIRVSNRDVKSGNCRVSSCEELLEDGVDEAAGTAGVVVFVLI